MDASTPTKNSKISTIRQLLGLGGFLVVVFFLLNFTGVFRKPLFASHSVTFRVEGSTSVAIVSYTQPNGSAIERFETTLPWKKTVYFNDPTTVVLIAGNPGQTGTLRCSLSVDGEEYDEDATTAPGDRVSCAGVTP